MGGLLAPQLPSTDILCVALAEALGSKVCVSREKKAVLECLESDRIARVVTTHPGEASVHVLPISKLSTEVTQQLWLSGAREFN